MSSPFCATENMREGENEEMSSLQCALSEPSFIKYAGYGPVEEMNFQTNIGIRRKRIILFSSCRDLFLAYPTGYISKTSIIAYFLKYLPKKDSMNIETIRPWKDFSRYLTFFSSSST